MTSPGIAACSLLITALALSSCGGGDLIVGDDPASRARVSEPVAGEQLQPVDDPKKIWWAHRTRLLAMRDWSAIGKLAIRSKDDAWNASMHWRQRGEEFRVRLSGPLGQGGVELSGNALGVVLKTADNRTYESNDPEQLLFDAVGWRVPLTGLRYWILGRSEPRVPVDAIQINVAGRVLMIEQSGWQIHYERYQEVGELMLPSKTSLDNPQFQAKVVVTRWDLDGDT